jgi:hypothetical protein
MSTDRIRIDLTKEQQDQIRQEAGYDAQAIELDIQELEQRVAPATYNFTDTQITKIQWSN